jgi:hypothetical protein
VEASRFRPEAEVSLRGLSNHPVVNITWYEARQYCDWLTDQLRAWEDVPEPLASLLWREAWQVTLLWGESEGGLPSGLPSHYRGSIAIVSSEVKETMWCLSMF